MFFVSLSKITYGVEAPRLVSRDTEILSSHAGSINRLMTETSWIESRTEVEETEVMKRPISS